jgi:hypothetical protein
MIRQSAASNSGGEIVGKTNTVRTVACEVVRVIISFWDNRILCGRGRDCIGEFFDIQTLRDESPVVDQRLFRFAEVRLEGFYPAKRGLEFLGSSGRGADTLLIGPVT